MRATTPILFASLLSTLLVPAVAGAYFRIELKDGGVILADGYQEENGKVTINRRSGSLEVPRASIRAIVEREGTAPIEESAAASAPRPGDSVAPTSADPVLPANASTTQLQQREDEIVQKIMEKHSHLAFARLRQAPPAELEARKKEIQALKRERMAVRKRLGLPVAEEQQAQAH